MAKSKAQKAMGSLDAKYNLYSIQNMQGWGNEEEQRRDLKRLKKNVKARLAALEKSDYAAMGKKALQETPFADVLQRPEAFTMQEQLAAYARIAEANISITGMKRTLDFVEEWAGEAAANYMQERGAIGYNEFMGAAKASGLLDMYGSEEVARLADMAEAGEIDAVQVLSNFRNYADYM